MKFKEGVELFKRSLSSSSLGGAIMIVVKPKTIEGMYAIANVYKSLGKELTVTSVCDGKHKAGSKHYEGYAFDCRTWKNSTGVQMSLREKEALANACRESLGEDWDVVVESTHLHIEYDPKG